uniref:F-box domain-containing protein n=1 Tax=Pithovirus LCPAC401 TaxID=2506595 RepID=A0A481Z9G9_9VIRU|nr:MAG: uncharacterized protein LCPAC401_00850 [Pithovirus LCPAC401]
MSEFKIEDILRERHMKMADFENSSDSTVREILLFISPAEISKLCRTSRKINRICTNESFWKVKVEQSYGTEKRYGDTWRKTAELFHKVNMINLNNKWIDGRTYAEIIKDTQKQTIIHGQETYGRIEYLRKLQTQYYTTIKGKGRYGIIRRIQRGIHVGHFGQYSLGPPPVPRGGPPGKFYHGKIFVINGSLHRDIVSGIGKELTDKEIETLEDVFTPEFAVIYRSFFEIDNTGVLPLEHVRYFKGIGAYNDNMRGILLPFVDVYPYIMYFSSLQDSKLNEIDDNEK